MSDVRICTHCKNAVEEIQYKDTVAPMGGDIQNKWRHARPRPYPICNVNPIMDDDTEWIPEGEYGD